jgi:Cu(I)/Ag(I) efflux system membrane fusion protein
MTAKNLSVLIVILAAAAGGYWFGQRQAPAENVAPVAAKAGERKPLYYRNPMGLPDTSPVAKKDPMGMDYIAVYEGEEAGDGGIRISPDRIQTLGVKTEPAAKRPLDRALRAAGRVEIDERRIYAVAPKFEGWVERLHVNATGQPVSRGQPLFEVYSPELVSAQREYALAAKGAGNLEGAETRTAMAQVAEAALLRLKNWDISEEQVKALAAGGEGRRTLTFRSPVSGVVTEKKAVQGMRFAPGDALYQVADLSSVWVIADVSEQDIGQMSGMVKAGAQARVKITAYPDKVFAGTVAYVYPRLTAETRTVPVRIELANPGGLLKPAMYAQVELPVAGRGSVLAVPLSAVIDSGTRQVVLVQAGEGRFAPRLVKLGARDDAYVEVIEGVSEGERVVTSANFLIDSESNLQSALGGLGEAPAKTGATVGHQAMGTLDAINTAAGTVTISHGPVASLKWPAMTMDFPLANPSLVAGLKPGTKVSVEFVERKPGEWVITKLEAKGR